MTTPSFEAVVVQDDATRGCAIELPFDPKEVYGRVRVPVLATIGQHRFRTTIFSMSGRYWIPLSRPNREASGAEAGTRVSVRLELDELPRTVDLPPDLKIALEGRPGALERWSALSFTQQREHVDAILGAKRPETRARRVARALEMLQEPRR